MNISISTKGDGEDKNYSVMAEITTKKGRVLPGPPLLFGLLPAFLYL